MTVVPAGAGLVLIGAVLAPSASADPYPPPTYGQGSVNRSAVHPGDCVQFSGGGFFAGAALSITDNNRPSTTGTAKNTGEFRVKVCFDSNATLGRHELAAHGKGANTAPRTVTADVTVEGVSQKGNGGGNGHGNGNGGNTTTGSNSNGGTVSNGTGNGGNGTGTGSNAGGTGSTGTGTGTGSNTGGSGNAGNGNAGGAGSSNAGGNGGGTGKAGSAAGRNAAFSWQRLVNNNGSRLLALTAAVLAVAAHRTLRRRRRRAHA